MRRHCSRREAPRAGLHPHRREAARAGPERRRSGGGGHDAEEDHDAGAPDVRREGSQAVQALRRGGAAARGLHGGGLRGYTGVLDRTVGAGEVGGWVGR
ncbi:unnamed protein product [Linum tenue]|uniref:Uncharacterized protein n=1 Tax=Linum tenue TaxID=586396 RepID=A0AAV0IGR8_9ROSI|nr:unnamed protein product [Linum tenue]